jgi:hypothetical protein
MSVIRALVRWLCEAVGTGGKEDHFDTMDACPGGPDRTAVELGHTVVDGYLELVWARRPWSSSSLR